MGFPRFVCCNMLACNLRGVLIIALAFPPVCVILVGMYVATIPNRGSPPAILIPTGSGSIELFVILIDLGE